MKGLYRLTNRSTPTLSNPTTTTTTTPPLPIKDDLQLEKLRITDQSFTPENQRNSINYYKTNNETTTTTENTTSSSSSSSKSSKSSSSSSKASNTTAPTTTTTSHQITDTNTNENTTQEQTTKDNNNNNDQNSIFGDNLIDHQSIGQAYQPPYQSYPSQNQESIQQHPIYSHHHHHHHPNHHHHSHPPANSNTNNTYHHPSQFLQHQSHTSTSSLSNSFHYPSNLNPPPNNNNQSLPLRQYYPPGTQNHPALAIPSVHAPQQQQPYGGINYGIGPPGYRDNSYLPLNPTLSQSHGRPMFAAPNPNLPTTTSIGFGSSSSSSSSPLPGLHQSTLARSGTSLSHSSSHSNMIAASNLSIRPLAPTPAKPGPTITKQSIDEYRNRIKSDPDPEAHFNYAKFLIEAAKKLASGGAAGDDKAIKKYRDALLQESLKLIKKLATQGVGLGKPPYSDAQFFLANCLGNGSLGLHVDHEKAYNLYVQASKQNHPAATYRTAVCNELGAGTRKDGHRAMLFYRKASALGDTTGMYKLGMILLNGLLGQSKNPQEALLWLKRAAQQADEDNPHALHELAQIYEKPPLVPIIGPSSNPTANPAATSSLPTTATTTTTTTTNATTTHTTGTKNHGQQQAMTYLVQRDEGYARELYTQAAQLGYPASQNRLGACYEYGALTCPVDPRRSIGWYTKAAERGDAESELALSGWYLTGSEGVLKQSDSEAYLWARRAASKGLPKAEYAVGYYSEVGIGVKQDLEEAKRWYMRAATNKNKRAMQRLTELKKMGAQKPGKKQTIRPTRDQAASECLIV